MMAWKKRFVLYLRIFVSLFLIGWLFNFAGTTEIVKALEGANLMYLAIMLVVANIDRILMAFKWNVLLSAKEIKLPIWYAIRLYYRATSAGIFIPAVGGDPIRIFEASYQTKKMPEVLSSVVIERALGFIAVTILGMLGLGLFFEQTGAGEWQKFGKFILLPILMILAFAFSLDSRWLMPLRRRLVASNFSIARKISKILISYQSYANHKQALFLFLVLSILEQFFPVTSSFLVSRALQLDIPFFTFVMFIPLIGAISRLPISFTFDGFGVREGLFVYLFALVGLQPADSLLIGLVTHVLGLSAIVPLSLYFYLFGNSMQKTTDSMTLTNSGSEII